MISAVTRSCCARSLIGSVTFSVIAKKPGSMILRHRWFMAIRLATVRKSPWHGTFVASSVGSKLRYRCPFFPA